MPSSIFDNSIFTLFRQVISIIFGLITTIIIARVLGTENQGIYAFITLIPVAAQTLLSLGIPLSTVYYIGKKKHQLESIKFTNLISGFVTGFIAFVLSILFLYYFPSSNWEKIPLSLIFLVVFSVVFISINKNLLSIFQGEENFDVYNFVTVLNQILLFLFISIFLLFFNLGIDGAFYAFTITHTIIFSILIYHLLKGNKIKLSLDTQYLIQSLEFGLKGHISNIVAFFNYRIDIFIIAIYLDASSVGIYSIAVFLVERIWIVSTAVSTVIYARLSQLRESKERKILTAKIGRIVLFVSTGLGIALALASFLLIPILFGHEYIEVVIPLIILIPGILLGSISRIFSNYFTASGNPEINSYVSIVVLTINVILNFVLIPIIGIIGAAWATTISYSINMFIKTYMFKTDSQFSVKDILLFNVEDWKLIRGAYFTLKRKYFA